MSREIKFSLVYRDMWQASGKYVPRVDQLTKIAPVIIDMGCFERVETNGGAFEQVNLLFGEKGGWATKLDVHNRSVFDDLSPGKASTYPGVS